jgi:hypothetical protein
MIIDGIEQHLGRPLSAFGYDPGHYRRDNKAESVSGKAERS